MFVRPLLVMLAVLVLAVASPGPAGAHAPHKVNPSASRAAQEHALALNVSHSRGVLRWAKSRRVSPAACDASRLARAQASRLDRDVCWHRRALAGWQQSRLEQLRAHLFAAAAGRDYLLSVKYVERHFGPQPFLRACPHSEGGFGEWVWNNGDGGGPYPLSRYPSRPAGSSGAGGWLQFMSSTFWSVIDDGIAKARARGMIVPASARSWFSPLGQALAGVEMLNDGRAGEWSGASC